MGRDPLVAPRVAGVVGVLVMLLLSTGLFWLIRRPDSSDGTSDTTHDQTHDVDA